MNCDYYDNQNDGKDDGAYNENDDGNANGLGKSSQIVNVFMVIIVIIIFGIVFQVIII